MLESFTIKGLMIFLAINIIFSIGIKGKKMRLSGLFYCPIRAFLARYG
jgi:hypothetical protein